ncbi:MAG: hypothetical protein ACE5KM_11290 [Planctomycetaceae bacterium]
MLHFSCDLCGRQLGERRFIVKMEVFASFDPEEIDESDLELDHLQAVSQELEAIDLTGAHDLDDCSTRALRYDLCPNCREKFLRDPLGRDAFRRLNFSEN